MQAVVEKKYNLYDVLPITKTSKRKNAQDKKDIQYISDKLEQLNSTLELIKTYSSLGDLNPSSDTSNFGKLVKKIREDINSVRLSYFKRNGFAPSEINFNLGYEVSTYSNTFRMRKYWDTLARLSDSPSITLSSARDLADKLDMVLFPFGYIDSRSYNSENYDMKQMISKFNKEVTEYGYDVYVLAPLNHYSLTSHVKHKNPAKPIYAGKNSMVFTSISLNIPLFRTIMNELDTLRDSVDNLNGTISNVKQNMQLMQDQITNLQRQVDLQREQQIKQQLENENKLKALNSKLEEMAFNVTDPVMIAFPKGTDINNPADFIKNGIVGPVWGPDFDGVALYSLDLEIMKDQRNLLNKTVQRIWK